MMAIFVDLENYHVAELSKYVKECPYHNGVVIQQFDPQVIDSSYLRKQMF